MIYYGFAFKDIVKLCDEHPEFEASAFTHTAYSVSAYIPEAGVFGVVIDEESSLFNPLIVSKDTLAIADKMPLAMLMMAEWEELPESIKSQAHNDVAQFILFENSDD